LETLLNIHLHIQEQTYILSRNHVIAQQEQSF